MSGDKNVSSFVEDDRVKFIGGKVCELLQLNRQTWERNAASEDFQSSLKNFFEKGSLVFFSSVKKGSLVASHEVQSDAKNEQVYILKKRVVPITSQNCRELLLIGPLTPSPVLQLSCVVKQTCASLLSSNKTHRTWPSLTSKDFLQHVETLYSQISVVQGQVGGKTVLPIPIAHDWMEKSPSSFEKHAKYDRAVAYAVETQVINWTNLFQKNLKEDSSDILMTGCNPGPSAELKFWASRKNNMESIYSQLQSPIVQRMVEMLEKMDSIYYPIIKAVIGKVHDALREAEDIDLHLKPLHAQLSQLDMTEFPLMETYIPSLFHTLYLVWINCQSYQKPARIVVLLQELCNLFIQQASTYLSADQLLKGDPEESLQMVKRVLNVFRCFKDNYQAQRERLASEVNHTPWELPSATIFSRFNQFFKRMQQLEEFFELMLDFEKIGKLEFGGNKGQLYSENAAKMHKEFTDLCQALIRSKCSPLDLNSQAFENEYTNFKKCIVDIESRLAHFLCLGCKDCSVPESAIKMITITRETILEKKQADSPNFLMLQQHFREELENCKSQLSKMVRGMNMSHTSEAFKLARMLRKQIQIPWEKLRSLYGKSADGVELVTEYSMYMDMLNLLDQYEKKILNKWCCGLEKICRHNLKQPLLSRNPTSDQISVNFNPKLTEIIKDVKYFQTLSSEISIPAAALALFEKHDMFTKYINSLQLLVQWYNKLKQTVLEVELPLIRAELESIDQQLFKAETSLTWQDENCWNFISNTKHLVEDLVCRVNKVKANCDDIQSVMKRWSKQGVFCRKSNKSDPLIQLEDGGDSFRKKCSFTKNDGESIHERVQENMVLFHADPDSEEWHFYLEYLDKMVVEGLFGYISHSLNFFLESMGPGSKKTPLFEAKLILSGSNITFCPSMKQDAGDSLYELVEELIANIFKNSLTIRRVAAHLSMESYQDVMYEIGDLLDLRWEIMDRVENIQKKAINYQTKFDCYTQLWQGDRAGFLKQFLLYGRALTSEEMNTDRADTLPDNPPTIHKFKEQIDYYEDLHAEISQLEDFRVFDGWFRVDIKLFKASLLNMVKKWSWLFIEHLLTNVTNSLDELQKFIQSTVEGLNQPLSKDNHSGFVKVMGHLTAVKDRQNTTDKMFEPLRDTVTLLEQYSVTIPDQIFGQMEELPEKWSGAKKLALKVNHDVVPMKNAEVLVLRGQCVDFEVKQTQFREMFRAMAPFSYNAVDPYISLEKLQRAVKHVEREVAELQENANLFDVAVPDYRDIKLCRREITVLKELWDIVVYVQSSVKNWTMTKWREINVEQMDAELKRLAKEIRKLDKEARVWDVFSGLDLYVKNLLTSLQAVSQLQNPAIREHHWVQLMKITKVDFTVTDSTTLDDLLALQLHLFEDDVSDMVEKAVKELTIEKVLTEISQTWMSMELSYEVHYQTSLPLLKFDDQLIETLEEHQVQLQGVLQSKYIDNFLSQVVELQKQLTVADSVLTVWMEVQRTWAYLESIFKGCDDICQQLPEDTEIFRGIDVEFEELMLGSSKVKNVIEATNKPNLFEKLEDLQKRLALCEKALAEYLETKRLAFPRFYFISSADLLDILSKGSRPKEVTAHLSKIFDNLADLEFNKNEQLSNPKVAMGMYSKEREYVAFQTECFCHGPVEAWLTHLEESMKECVRGHLSKAVSTLEDGSREQWILSLPAQVALTGSQVSWTNDMELAFKRMEGGHQSALKDYNKKQISQLDALIGMLLGELSSGDRQKIMTICTIDVHARDIVASLIVKKVTTSLAFQWLSQLRLYWNVQHHHCYINICDAQFIYSYEYLGNTPRLVITPLTDRCYITLTQSLHLNMSGAPSGPAGTGKTETTKDLGRALGVMVYVFNCSEQMDYKSIGNIYKGLVQTGAWGCFDEFNRITVDVLSVVAVQVKSIQDAIRCRKKRFLFLDNEIILKRSVGIFITMNPGYAGRAELPENLKSLFRPCAMVVPDTELICEIMLVAEGFRGAKLLAKKFIALYSLCKELLSKQGHYDWGLRAVKSVLVLAGTLRRRDKARPEDQVLMRALRDFNMSKVVTDDEPVFLGLLRDLFPGLEVERQRDLEFEKAVRKTTLDLQLQPEETFILKVAQLEELMAVRHSVFVVGNAGTGKSQIMNVLHKTYVNLKKKPVWNDLNPKAIDRDELFGFIHPATREWKDGLLSSLMREQANMSQPGPKWIVLDGDIDPMWIESLNTVMDDNKVLTLASNERVVLTSSMRLVFEISHLKMATPATVSRAGILYVNPQDLGWNPYVSSWIYQRELQTERAYLIILFEKYVPRCLEQMKNAFRTITPIPEISMVQTLCTLLDGLLTPQNIPCESPCEIYEAYFTFACIWAFGGALYQDQLCDYRVEFSQWWTKEMKTVNLPAKGTVFDYYLDHETKQFLPWDDTVPPFDMDIYSSLQAVLVHTAETVRLRYFVDLLLERRQPVMLVGNAGVGKTALVRNKLDCLPESYMTTKVPLNYYTTSLMLQALLEQPLEKRAGRGYYPIGNRRLIYFIDDMNMPAVDSYGTVQPHTLIRQHLDYGHWYDRQKLTLKEIYNTQYFACMNPTAGSFVINPRLQRHFSVFAVNFPSSDAQKSIFSQILCSHLKQQPFNPLVPKGAPAVVQAAISLHHKVVQNFLPTAIKFHYIFNLRDLANVFQGILFCGPENVKNTIDLALLWHHESSRVYSDRLIDVKDLQLFQKLQLETVQECFEGLEDKKLPLLFFHFAHSEEPSYAPVTDWSALSTILTGALEGYNEVHPAMNLVLFEDAMQHVCRINRILEAPRGHGLLVGVGGSGKQSLTHLAAYISSVEVFQIIPSKNYTVQDFKLDLARLFLKAGVQNQRVALLLTDAQIPDDRFLVVINDFLASGDVPEVFSEDEIKSIISGVRAGVRSLGLLDTWENSWKFFTDRVRLQLTVVLCLSPVGSALQVRARQFPALINCTIIDWFHPWTPEALQSVSHRFIQEIEGIEPAIQQSISFFMAYGHTSVNQASEKYQRNEKRYNYTTPKSFLQQIILYRNLLDKSQAQLQYKMNRLKNGLQKLKTTAAQVEDLKVKLASQDAELAIKNANTDALITKIGRQTERVSTERVAADAEAQKVSAIQAEISIKQKECESDLKKTEPLLNAATTALNTLNKVNLTELKAFANPPPAVMNVVAAVMVLLAPRGRVPKDRSWKAARAFMGKIDNFLQALVTYKKEDIPEASLTVVKQEYLNDPEFNPDLVLTKSKAAAGLCAWTINIVNFYELYCDMIPKKEALEQADAELKTATAKLLAVQKKLGDLDASLQKITARYEMATAEKLSCQEEVTRTTQTIELANRLVRGLMSEKDRWSLKIVQFEKQQKTLCGDILLTSAFVSYMGYFTSQYRVELFHNEWIPFLQSLKVPIPLTDGLDPVLMLTDDATAAAWHNQGLPNDRMSIENAAILTTSERWPLIVDPQQQGIKWIRNKIGPELRVVQLGHKRCLDVIEQAVVFGETVLIENLPEKVDPALEPLLSKKTIKRGRYILIGGKECEYNSNFKLILHTKLANPHYLPELQAQTTLINFTVTPTGLEEQLLGQVVSRERPDLEVLKTQLTTQQNRFKIELKGFEDDLLSRLSAAHGNFLGDIVLVEQLENARTMAAHIQIKVAEARENERKINEARELYRPAAARASLLFFIINDLSKINLMYQFSLKTFNSVFNKAMERAEWNEDVRSRVRILTEAITYSVFLQISQGLFEKDKLTFLLHTAFQIQLKQRIIEPHELDFLLRFPVEVSKDSPVPFLTPSAWGAVKTISAMEGFNGLDRDIEGLPNSWSKIVESSYPEKERLPQEWKNKGPLQKLIILKALRPDRVTYTLRTYLEKSMGTKYVDAARLEFEKLFEDCGPSTPVFFILSPGMDPLRDVEKLGLKLGFSIDQGTLHNVSLGQGQEVVAETVLKIAFEHGHWVILQNVHLVGRWLPTLDALLETTAVGSHPNYRVFITGEPAPCPEQHVIPRGILENAIKITNEPPTGMNACLHAALGNFTQETLEMCSRKQEFNSMLFTLCFFHSCVTERRKFGPQGWNINYPFSTGDLTISANVLYSYLETSTKVPWEDLCYLFGEIMYGGHITDNWDRRLCKTYLQEFMGPKLFEAECFLCPGFLAPPFLDYIGYHGYIDEYLPSENPTLYGLHPNTELEYLTVTSDNLLKTLLELQPQSSSSGEGTDQSVEEKVTSIIEDILDRLPEEYNMTELMSQTTDRDPYTLVCFQECQRMNLLLAEIKKSLHELNLGLKGELTFSSRMETLQSALFMDHVPDSWARLAYPSTKTLTQWLSDLICSCHELENWTGSFILPAVVWLSGLFNPQSFLTAVLQSIARKNQWALDKMTLTVDVTKKMKDEVGHSPREGAYIHGLFMEGARWDTQAGVISEAVLRDLTPSMPVLYVKAVPAEERDIRNTFECPVYRTKQRGPTYVWTFHLQTKQPAAKWIIAGVALLLSV